MQAERVLVELGRPDGRGQLVGHGHEVPLHDRLLQRCAALGGGDADQGVARLAEGDRVASDRADERPVGPHPAERIGALDMVGELLRGVAAGAVEDLAQVVLDKLRELRVQGEQRTDVGEQFAVQHCLVGCPVAQRHGHGIPGADSAIRADGNEPGLHRLQRQQADQRDQRRQRDAAHQHGQEEQALGLHDRCTDRVEVLTLGGLVGRQRAAVQTEL